MRVAEGLFAEEGFDAVSLRRIMDVAGVPISQLNYHFGTKKDLVRAIFQTKLGALTEERLRILAEAERQQPPSLEQIVEAYFGPTFRTLADPALSNLVRLVARVGADSSEISIAIAAEFLDVVQQRFAEALARALPDLSPREIYWRIHVMLCVAIQTHVNPKRIKHLSNGLCDPQQADEMFKFVQPILCAALRAPAGDEQKIPAARKAARQRAT